MTDDTLHARITDLADRLAQEVSNQTKYRHDMRADFQRALEAQAIEFRSLLSEQKAEIKAAASLEVRALRWIVGLGATAMLSLFGISHWSGHGH